MPRVRYGIPEGTAPPGIPASGTFAARVTVVDGDTLATGGGRLRLHGVDAPESAQTCRRRGSDYPCGQEASRAMARILGGGTLSCQVLDTDRYGRRVARCRNAQGTDIGAELVRQGWAIAFTRYSADYVRQESEARAARRGMWEGSFETPSDWRARRRP
ncbi:thermonuclease family protein [Roseomonas soli]|uniref:Thermonuclease family protein n=2 Tax=Neoroseomonas soli TaxID=1081025 RepID=A0A9X9X0G3_9PROT|nr:thermonuclease family protein [Neoroseomonas soli]